LKLNSSLPEFGQLLELMKQGEEHVPDRSLLLQ
jgi:hypothetical protein